MASNILLSIPNFRTAGSQNVVLSLYKLYKALGWQTYILIEEGNGYFPDEVSLNDRIVLVKSGYLNPIEGAFYIRNFMNLLSKYKFDVVHSWDYRSEPWEAIACRLVGVPYVYTKKNNAWSKKWWLKSLLANQIAYDQPQMAARFFSHSLLNKKATFIPHGINLELFKPGATNSKPSGVIGCIGNIGANKNQIVILKALAASNLDLRCKFYGKADETYLNELNQFISENKLQDKIEFKGYIKNTDLPEVIKSLDILILSSFNEGLPVTLLEAIACGTYCIASDSGGGTRYIFDVCETGSLFDPDNHLQLCGLIEDYYMHSNSKENTARDAIKKVKSTFSAETEAQKYLSLFNNLIN